MRAQLDDLGGGAGEATHRRTAPRGVHLTFAADGPVVELARLAQVEHGCCSSFATGA